MMVMVMISSSIIIRRLLIEPSADGATPVLIAWCSINSSLPSLQPVPSLLLTARGCLGEPVVTPAVSGGGAGFFSRD